MWQEFILAKEWRRVIIYIKRKVAKRIKVKSGHTGMELRITYRVLSILNDDFQHNFELFVINQIQLRPHTTIAPKKVIHRHDRE